MKRREWNGDATRESQPLLLAFPDGRRRTNSDMR